MGREHLQQDYAQALREAQTPIRPNASPGPEYADDSSCHDVKAVLGFERDHPLVSRVCETREHISHKEFRDDRVAFFADTLKSGFWEFTYLARAVTRGRFTVPPVRAEAMYDPDVFARSAMIRAVVK